MSTKIVNEIFAKARNATYYAFDEEFYTILGGPSPDIEEVALGSKHLYYEGGGWLFDRNEVWMASEILTVISVLNLETYRTTTLDIPALRDTNPVGFDYHDGLVYVACAGNETTPNGALAVYAVDPGTLEVTPILNNFFGLRTLVADDITIVKPNTAEGATSCTVPGETNIFFTSFSLGSQGFPFTLPETLPNAGWRFSPQPQSLQGAIARADVKSPNGICVDPSGRCLYVTDTDAPQNRGNAIAGGGAQSSGSSAIFRFDLDEDCIPYNKKLIDLVRSYADGLHIDDYGRIWTAEYDGIVVRKRRGKILGVSMHCWTERLPQWRTLRWPEIN